MNKPKLCDFLLDLHQSLAHQGLAKSLDISIGMPTLFANLAASRSWRISSQKIAQLRLNPSCIAQIAIEAGALLLHKDKDFSKIANIRPLEFKYFD